MTTLAITPSWKNKSAKFKGMVAAGEHVSVTIQNENGEGGEFIEDVSTLRLRVVDPCNGRTLAIFPEPVSEGETPETWDTDLSPLRCTLNLNTVQMLKAVPPAANVPLLWVLDDYDNNTLYFKEQFEVTHWPRLCGEEEPTDLDNYKDIIADFNTRLDGYDSRITAAENAAQAATENASTAAAKANQAVDIANRAVDKAETAQNSAAASAEAAAVAQVAAEAAQAAAEEAAESINSPDATLSEEGVAADAKATGEAIAAEEARATAAEAAEEARAKGAEGGLRTDLTAAEKAINDEAQLRAAADADLEANKADKATTYTKTEVDTKIAGVQTFKKYLVQTLPDPDEADMKGLYLVPTGETSEEGDLCEEWTVVGEVGSRRWEKIGAKAVDLTLDNAVTRASANGVKSSGIWAMIWGALASLPSGFTSLYDWCVAQLAGKASTADATLMPIYSDTPTFSEWTFNRTEVGLSEPLEISEGLWKYHFSGDELDNYSEQVFSSEAEALVATELTTTTAYGDPITATRTRTDIFGYQLGSQSDKPLASEAEAEALRNGKLDKSGGTVTGEFGVGAGPLSNFQVIPEISSPSSYTPPTMRFGDGAGVIGIIWRTEDGYVTADVSDYLGVTHRISYPSASGTLALTSAIPYTLGTPIVIDTASSEVVEGETVNYGAATLANRTANSVQVTAATALDELRIAFPAATSGKVRDFGLRVEIGTGSAALTAPALVPIVPPGETIKIENADGTIPALADGTATAKGVTLLYFSETAPGVFVVKGEQVEEVA